ncbi:MAG: hypothetical protein ABIT47_03775 [Candidatus Paceibacterota bacterium]
MTKTNMSGAQQTRICRIITRELRAEFALHDAAAGERLEQEAMMSEFISDVIVAVRKGLVKKPDLFASATTYAISAAAGKETKMCLVGEHWMGVRSGNFSKWLPAFQPKADASVITVLKPSGFWTFVDAVVSILKASPNTPPTTIGSLLKTHGHTMTLPQVELMVEATRRGQKTGMLTNGHANFFFLEKEDGSISLGSVTCAVNDPRWGQYIYELSKCGDYKQDDVYRLMLCNMDPSKLGF